MEPVIDPDRPILDAHVHLWRRELTGPYLLDDLRADMADGHRVEQVIHVECAEHYRTDGPPLLRSLGETEHFAALARWEPRIAGIVANIDLRLGPALADTVAAHQAAGGGRFCGVRHPAARDLDGRGLDYVGRADPTLLADPAFAEGMRTLGRLGVANDQLLFFHQLPAFIPLAQAAPDTVIVLNHLGFPLRGGYMRDRVEEMRNHWLACLARLAALPNVFVKIGGFAGRDAGFDWMDRATPPSSDAVAAAWRPWMGVVIDLFGPQRCMLEANYPVDRAALPYRTVWNAFKKLTAEHSDADRKALFMGAAQRAYGLPARPAADA